MNRFAFVRRLPPRPSGIFGMFFGLGLAIFGGALIPRAWVGIAGALIAVAGTIVFALSALLIARNSWDADHWPDASLDQLKFLKRLRLIAIIQAALTPLFLALGISQLVEGRTIGWVSLLLTATTLFTAASTLLRVNALRKSLDDAKSATSDSSA